MKLSDVAVKEFKKAWREEYGENLTDEEAHTKALQFLTLFKTIYRTMAD